MHIGMMKELFDSAGKRGDLVNVSDINLAFAVEIGIQIRYFVAL